jgi:hypothetical protein
VCTTKEKQEKKNIEKEINDYQQNSTSLNATHTQIDHHT